MAATPRDAVPPLNEPAHEAAVAAFLKSTPKRDRERAERHHQVLTERRVRQILKHESSRAGDMLDEVLVVHGSGTGTGQAPGYVRGGLRHAPAALGLGRHVFTSEIEDDTLTY